MLQRSGAWVLGKTHPAHCQECQLPVGVLEVGTSFVGLLPFCELGV